jgi:NAD(P)-dependent dehydrogenase (short-subunit alcohol dehydrogenase family)
MRKHPLNPYQTLLSHNSHIIMSDTPLSEQVILVTGAASGLGAAVAKCYASHGATVIMLDKDLAGLEATYDAIYPAYPKPAIYPLDLKGAGIDDYADLVAAIESNFGHLDALTHCAASLGQLAPIEHQVAFTWAETLHINLTAPFLLTQACLPLMKKQDKATIIFTTDQHKDNAYWAGYGISKAGIETLAKQLQDELEAAGRIQVHCIEPGQFQSPLLSQAYPALNPNDFPLPDKVTTPYLTVLKH